MSEELKPYYNRSDSALVTFSKHFVQTLESEYEAYGLSSGQVAYLSTVNAEWIAAAKLAGDPSTKTSLAVKDRDGKRRQLLTAVRNVIAVINSTQGVDDAMKLALGISIPKPRRLRERVDVAPNMLIASRDGNGVTLKITLPGSKRAAKGRTTESIMVYYHVGEGEPPTDPAKWVFVSAYKRSLCHVDLPSDLPVGTRVSFTARYYNRAGYGPSAPAIHTYIAGGGGAFATSPLKWAA